MKNSGSIPGGFCPEFFLLKPARICVNFSSMEVLAYSNGKEAEKLSKISPNFARAIKKYGTVRKKLSGSRFEIFCQIVVQQQISGRAAESIWGKLKGKFGRITPEIVLKAESLEGLSFGKASCLRGAAEAVLTGKLNFSKLAKLSDSEISDFLIGLGGVGKWTAEMALIFAFQRPDVLSFSDFGIRVGAAKILGVEKLEKAEFEMLRKKCSPFGTAASLWIWEAAGDSDF